MNNASCSLRQSKVQFCQFFGMNGAVFLKFGKGACGLSCARTFCDLYHKWVRAMKVNRTILFVEDDAVVLTTYRNLLQREGFRIESAQDGLEALKALSQATPDLVVLDLMLPKFDGADVLKFIRADPRLKSRSNYYIF